jgi:uncharacterized membrane protein
VADESGEASPPAKSPETETPEHSEDVEAIPASLAEVVAEEVDQPPDVVERIVAAAWHYSGPLPTPEMLRGYDSVVPGAAERIVAMAEREQGHRHWLDRTFVNYRFVGLAVAALISLAVIGGGVFLIFEDKNAIGLAIILTQLVVLAGVFIYQERHRNGKDEDSAAD